MLLRICGLGMGVVSLFSLFYAFSYEDSALVSMTVLELSMVAAAACYSVSEGNMGFLFVIFCMMGVETCILMAVFVGVVRYKGETRISGKKSVNSKERVLKKQC